MIGGPGLGRYRHVLWVGCVRIPDFVHGVLCFFDGPFDASKHAVDTKVLLVVPGLDQLSALLTVDVYSHRGHELPVPPAHISSVLLFHCACGPAAHLVLSGRW